MYDSVAQQRVLIYGAGLVLPPRGRRHAGLAVDFPKVLTFIIGEELPRRNVSPAAHADGDLICEPASLISFIFWQMPMAIVRRYIAIRTCARRVVADGGYADAHYRHAIAGGATCRLDSMISGMPYQIADARARGTFTHAASLSISTPRPPGL